MQFNATMYYFSKYTGSGVLLIPQTGKPFLIVPQLDEERARQTKTNVIPWKKKKLFETLQETMKKEGIGRKNIGIDYEHLTLSWHHMLKKELGKKLIDIHPELISLRRTKTKEEQDIIQEGCRKKISIFQKTLDAWNNFKTEGEAAAHFQYIAAQQGFSLSFPTIVASGKHASLPHYEPSQERLQRGFCVIDCGIRYQGYCTDMTRTLFIGNPTQKEKQLYEFILSIQEEVMEHYKAGAKVSDLDFFVRKKLGKYEKLFIHSLGHGVGLDVHEAPPISARSKEILQEHEYVTNEPGIYLPRKYGIRIEDDLLITKKSPIVLTKACSKQLQCF